MEQFAPTNSFLEPEKIVRVFGLEKGDFVADFGAGHGFFVIPIARIVGGKGKVFAIDLQKEALSVIAAKAKSENLMNVEIIRGDVEATRGSRLKDGFIDVVFASSIFFQSEREDAIAEEAYRILRDGGRFIVIEWDETGSKLGPRESIRIKKNDLKDIVEGAGFVYEKEFSAGGGSAFGGEKEFGAHHYGLMFMKKV